MRFLKILPILSILFLTGCGNGAPGSSDIENALNSTNDQKLEQLSALLGGKSSEQYKETKKMMPVFKNVKVKECEKNPEAEMYLCDYTVTIEAMGEKQKDIPTQGLFTKRDGDWVVQGGGF